MFHTILHLVKNFFYFSHVNHVNESHLDVYKNINYVTQCNTHRKKISKDITMIKKTATFCLKPILKLSEDWRSKFNKKEINNISCHIDCYQSYVQVCVTM